jgi:hypothetical protein
LRLTSIDSAVPELSMSRLSKGRKRQSDFTV